MTADTLLANAGTVVVGTDVVAATVVVEGCVVVLVLGAINAALVVVVELVGTVVVVETTGAARGAPAEAHALPTSRTIESAPYRGRRRRTPS